MKSNSDFSAPRDHTRHANCRIHQFDPTNFEYFKNTVRGIVLVWVAFTLFQTTNAAPTDNPSFFPTFFAQSDKHQANLEWTYVINGGNPITDVDDDGDSVSFDFSEAKVLYDTKKRQKILSFSFKGTRAVEGTKIPYSSKIQVTEMHALAGSEISVLGSTFYAEVKASNFGINAVFKDNINFSYVIPLPLQIVNKDLSTLAEGESISVNVPGCTLSGSSKTTIPGDSGTESFEQRFVATKATWKVLQKHSFYTVQGKTYPDVLEVEFMTASTADPLFKNTGVTPETQFETNSQVTYWLARGVGAIKTSGELPNFRRKRLTIELKSSNLSLPGSTQKISLPVLKPLGVGKVVDPLAVASSGLKVNYTSSNASVAVVTSDGLIQAIGPGTTMIGATQPGDQYFTAAQSVQTALTVLPSVDTNIIPNGAGSVAGTGVYSVNKQVSLTATPAKGYVFLKWETGDQNPKRTLTLGPSGSKTTATFGLLKDVSPPKITAPETQSTCVTRQFNLGITVTSLSLAKTTVNGLPPGLTFDTASGAIKGRLTQAGSYKVTVNSSNIAGNAEPIKFYINIDPPQTWVVGDFTALLSEERDSSISGVLRLTNTDRGVISGNLLIGPSRYSVSGAINVMSESERANKPVTADAVVSSGAGKTTANIKITLNWLPEDLGLSGNILLDGKKFLISHGYKHVWNAKSKPAFGGKKMTVNLSLLNRDPNGPSGQSSARVELDPSGSVSWLVTLASKKSLTGSFIAPPTGHLPFWSYISDSQTGSIDLWIGTQMNDGVLSVETEASAGHWKMNPLTSPSTSPAVEYKDGFNITLGAKTSARLATTPSARTSGN